MLQIQWTQPYTTPNLVVENYIIRINFTNEQLLAKYDTEGTDYSVPSDCNYVEVCVHANTSAGTGCETCQSKGKHFVYAILLILNENYIIYVSENMFDEFDKNIRI